MPKNVKIEISNKELNEIGKTLVKYYASSDNSITVTDNRSGDSVTFVIVSK